MNKTEYIVKLSEDELRALIIYNTSKLDESFAKDIEFGIETSARIHDLCKRLERKKPSSGVPIAENQNPEATTAAGWPTPSNS